MKRNLFQNKLSISLFSLGLILVGLGLVYLGIQRPVLVKFNNSSKIIPSRSYQVAGLLKQINYQPKAYDVIQPSPDEKLGWQAVLNIQTASQVYLSISKTTTNFPSLYKIPANILSQAGIKLFPGDQVYLDGQLISPNIALPERDAYFLEYKPAKNITLVFNGEISQINSAASDLGSAFWESGLRLSKSEALVIDLSSAPQNQQSISIRPSQEITIQTAQEQISFISAAATVGQALSQAGLSLQGLDTCQPPENAALPENGIIRITRVSEEVVLEQTGIPYTNEYVADSTLELDLRSIVTQGQYGLQVSQTRIRYENGSEIWREVEAEWTAAEPVTQQTGYGTLINTKIIDTPDGPLEYWRAAQVYATSFSPCRLGVDYCNDVTASGLILQKGIIGVACSWFSELRGQRLYVPGYGVGVIGDCGASIPGKFLIDLGYSDDDYVGWHQDITAYFLAPVPDNIPWIFP